jgi:heptaprenyl diphosphate synthase
VEPLAPLGFPALAGDLTRLESALKTSVEAADPFLTDVATHLIGAGGKRLRPVLTLCSGYTRHGPDAPAHDDLVTGGIAVELVHLGSLYHDDVIDEAATRRGVETVNARWTNTVAILAGDFLLARASELAASLGTEVAGLLAATIGELCTGEVLELRHAFDVDHDADSYFHAITGKTASLIATSCRIGGIVAGHDRPAIETLTRFGHHLGMVFQLVDDVLDLSGSAAQLGKPVGHDLYQGVYTLPVIVAVRSSEELRSLLGGPVEADEVERIRRLVADLGGLDAALGVAREHLAQAEAVLRADPALDPTVVDGLLGYAHSLFTRDH